MEVLYNSGEIHHAIKKVLEGPRAGDRRIALVAFVGGHAEAFLPDPKGLELVCWLQPGASDALTIGRLLQRGAKVYKSERLHMKVYWSSARGCVICSANASGNALGGGDQKEAGVWLPPGRVDIDRLWTYAKPAPIEDRDLKCLAAAAKSEKWLNSPMSKESPPDFLEWRSLPGREDWKLGWWSEYLPPGRTSVDKAQERYGVAEPTNYLNVKEGQTRQSDWILLFKVPGVTLIKWMYVDFVVRIQTSDRRAYEENFPFQAVQANPSRNCPRIPFAIDERFRDAFRKAIREYRMERIEGTESLRPSKKLLDLVATKMRPPAL